MILKLRAGLILMMTGLLLASCGEDRIEEQVSRLRAALMEQIAFRQSGKRPAGGPLLVSGPQVVTWLEHRPPSESVPAPVHTLIDVCAGEHCRLYPGLTPAADSHARGVIDETWGEIM